MRCKSDTEKMSNIMELFSRMDDELKNLGLPTHFGKREKKIVQIKKGMNFHLTTNGVKKEGNEDFEIERFTVPLTIERKEMKQVGPTPEAEPQIKFPTIQEFNVVGHSKIITAIAIDSSGNKVFTGSSDCSVKYWNFATMKASDPSAETSIELDTAFEINALDVSNDAKLILLATGTPEAKLFDGKGLKKGETKRGDMYLYDPKNTVGHVAALTGAQFKPNDSSVFATSSVDGTLRFWDSNKLSKQKMLFKLSQKGGIRNKTHAMVWSVDGSGVYVCANDPFIRYYNASGPENQTELKIQTPGINIAITAAKNGYNIASKSNRNILLWDIRKTEKPVWNIEVDSDGSYINFSPDSNYLLVPKMVKSNSKYGGCIHIIKNETGTTEPPLLLPSGVGACCCKWHDQTNQIVVGCSDGSIRVMFDPRISKNGIMLSLQKGLIIKNETDDAYIGELIPRLVDPENERVIRGFWFKYTSPEIRAKRQAAAPKAPLWGEGHHGQLAVHPVQAELAELDQIDVPDNTDILDALKSRSKLAENKYFTNVTEYRQDDEE